MNYIEQQHRLNISAKRKVLVDKYAVYVYAIGAGKQTAEHQNGWVTAGHEFSVAVAELNTYLKHTGMIKSEHEVEAGRLKQRVDQAKHELTKAQRGQKLALATAVNAYTVYIRSRTCHAAYGSKKANTARETNRAAIDANRRESLAKINYNDALAKLDKHNGQSQ